MNANYPKTPDIVQMQACNPRNTYAGEVFNSRAHAMNLYGNDIEVDYR